MNPKFVMAFAATGALPVALAGDAMQRDGAMRSSSPVAVALVSLLTAVSLLAFLSLAWSAPALSAEPAQAQLLVARPAVSDPVYGQSILVVHELPGRRHVGFILNKPTAVKLTEAFPGHEASKAVTDPLFLGGTSNMDVIFALVRGQTTPVEGTLALTKDLYIAVSASAVDKAIESAGEEHARFFIGAVVWQPGELDAEIRQGAWYVLEATTELVLPRQTAGLWAELVRQEDMVVNGI